MACEPDELDTNKLSTIGIVTAFAVAAISYLAAGMYHERLEEIQTEGQTAPSLDHAQDAKAAGPPDGIEDAMREVAGDQ